MKVSGTWVEVNVVEQKVGGGGWKWVEVEVGEGRPRWVQGLVFPFSVTYSPTFPNTKKVSNKL